MSRYMFNDIFKEIMDTYYIDSAVLGEKIDRDSSRIRHYKTDGKPGKAVLDKLVASLCEMIEEKNDSYSNLHFINRMNASLQSKGSFSEDLRDTLAKTSDIKTYLTILLRKSHEFCKEAELHKPTPAKAALPLGDHSLITQVSQAHQYFESNLYEEAIGIYEGLLADPRISELPVQKQTIYTDLGLIFRNKAFSQYDESVLQRSVSYLDIAAQTALANEDLLGYGLIHKFLGTIYSFRYNFDDPEYNLGKSSQYYDIALSVLQKIDQMEEHAKVLINYGILFLYYSTVRNTRNFLKNSISYLKRAIDYFDTQQNAYFKALAYLNCSGAYSFLAEICNSEPHAKEAIHMVQEALKVFTIEEYPILYAQSVSNLGHIHIILTNCNDAVQNAEKAIHYIHHALTIATEDTDTTTYLISHLNLSAVHLILSRHTNRQDNITKAIESLEICQKYYKAQSNSINQLKSNLNRAEVLIDLGELNADLTHIRTAEAILKDQLVLCRDMNFIFFGAIANYAMSRVFYNYYKSDSDQQTLALAVNHARKALEVFTIHDYPLNYAQAMHLLARIHDYSRDYDSSRQEYENMLRIFTHEKYSVKYREAIEEYNVLLKHYAKL